MNILPKALVISFCLICALASKAFAEPILSAPSNALVVQIAQEQIIFDKTTVESASIEQTDNSSN